MVKKLKREFFSFTLSITVYVFRKSFLKFKKVQVFYMCELLNHKLNDYGY